MIWGYISDDRFLPEPVHGYVYFIRDGLGHIKIGIAKNVKRRMRALQTNNPMRLEYYFGLKVESIDDARIIERENFMKFLKMIGYAANGSMKSPFWRFCQIRRWIWAGIFSTELEDET